ncbi:hypothetical protein D3C85_1408050 [compost metagenome]
MRWNAKHLGRRLTQLDELADAGHEVRTQQPATLNAETDLLKLVDSLDNEGLSPAALGGIQRGIGRPGLLPRREDRLQLPEKGIDDIDRSRWQRLRDDGHRRRLITANRCAQVCGSTSGFHELGRAPQRLWLAHRTPSMLSAQSRLSKSGDAAER